jgi:hypothetical protein
VSPAFDVETRVRQVAADELRAQVADIDLRGLYPDRVLQRLADAGLFRAHLRADGLGDAIEGLAAVAEECLTTAFLCWCQMACAWYVRHARADAVRERLLAGLAAGAVPGGTALSNPMKARAGIEPLRLTGEPAPGGYRVSGHVPFVSNMGPGHWFAGIFAVEKRRLVAAMFQCGAMDGLTGGQTTHFAALDGTRTFSVRLRSVLVPHELVLADPAEPWLAEVVPGFLLLQTALAIGLVRDCLCLIQRADRTHAHVNRFLADGPKCLEEALEAIEHEVADLSAKPEPLDPGVVRRTLRTRLNGAELALRAAQSAMLRAGAGGFTRSATPQRRLREAQFLAILTPAIRHLRRELDVEGRP